MWRFLGAPADRDRRWVHVDRTNIVQCEPYANRLGIWQGANQDTSYPAPSVSVSCTSTHIEIEIVPGPQNNYSTTVMGITWCSSEPSVHPRGVPGHLGHHHGLWQDGHQRRARMGPGDVAGVSRNRAAPATRPDVNFGNTEGASDTCPAIIPPS